MDQRRARRGLGRNVQNLDPVFPRPSWNVHVARCNLSPLSSPLENFAIGSTHRVARSVDSTNHLMAEATHALLGLTREENLRLLVEVSDPLLGIGDPDRRCQVADPRREEGCGTVLPAHG